MLDLILGLRDAGPGLVRSNRGGGWHSDPAFMAVRDPHLAWVLQNATAYATQALAPFYDGWDAVELRMGSYWANVVPEGGWHSPHHHHPAHWSGVYYVDAPEGSGLIEFLNPSPVQSQWRRGSFAHEPRAGSILLFPSSLVHLVHPHEAEDERVTVAFNLNVVPSVGS